MLELSEVVSLKDGVDSEGGDLNLHGIAPIEALVLELWVFDLFLVVAAEVPVFMATEVWLGCIRVPNEVLGR